MQNTFATIQKAQSQTDEFLHNLTVTAAAQGVALVARGSVVPVSQFPDWPTKLTEILCQDTSLAAKSNADLVSVIEARSGKTGLDHTLLSKKLSPLQRSYAADILQQRGYSPATLVTGTDIKRIVRDGVRIGTPEALEAAVTEIKTTFIADGLSIDGRVYQYRQRQTVPAGSPWYDFCIRIGGIDTPLYTVLVLRGVGIGEFRNKDEAAIRAATPEQAQRRKRLDREPQKHRGVPRF